MDYNCYGVGFVGCYSSSALFSTAEPVTPASVTFQMKMSTIWAVKKLLAEHRLIMFSKSSCPFCLRCKLVLNKTGKSYHVVELDAHGDGKQLQESLSKLSGIRTVPQTFLDGEFLGDSTIISNLYDSGKLSKLFEKRELPVSDKSGFRSIS